ncbi:hypothetical protein MVEN_02129600 [Mycena venus]|uniref:Uncharacterized protein n=1 Tax=Mycena venus TaxID=2733690 RepID=A0A8H6X9G7_9AGAR|nr:hypothetical protein MVEN_02129600 [Mycena venus]
MATSPNPYLLVPVSNGHGGQQNSNGVPSPTRASIAQTVSNLSSTATNLAASSANLAPPVSGANASGSSANPNANVFRAPAHKHAHHLHSIPPREKSTRTLIIDHMLWVHGRTRFAQARAELGMTDRTGGPGTPQYQHRHRPENYEEEDDVGSDGEDAVTLKARAGDPGRPHNDDEDERLRSQDLVLARSLRLRAEGLEKVITSMLDQPPPEHRPIDEELLTPPTSPRILPSGARTPGPHVLPNGVRLRLALGTMINDLFARQAPVPPHRDRHQASSSTSPVATSPSTGAPSPPLPPALTTLATISAACPDKPSVQPWTRPSSSMRPGPGPMSNPALPQPPAHVLAHSTTTAPTRVRPTRPRPSAAHGTCTRGARSVSRLKRPSAASAREAQMERGGARPLLTAGTARAPGSSTGRRCLGGVSPEGGGITGWQDGSGIGSGLARPARGGTVLRRKTKGCSGDGTSASVGGNGNGTGHTKLPELITRFVRLSAMVAAEMGREARGEEEEPAPTSPADDPDAEADKDGEEDLDDSEGMGTSPMSTERWGGEGAAPPPDMVLPPPAVDAGAQSGAQSNPSPYENRTPMYESALRPSREWYLLLAGLLTRAVLEGYLTAGWRGPDAVDTLLKVGLGLGVTTPASSPQQEANESEKSEKEKDEFAQFDPDELPSLLDAARMLFPAALRDGNAARKGLAEEEFEMEMETRLRRFYDIPQSTPDLSTHMEDLAWQYPAEPVERAAVRFCEAIEKWRGKPELETYKKKAPRLILVVGTGYPQHRHGGHARFHGARQRVSLARRVCAFQFRQHQCWRAPEHAQAVDRRVFPTAVLYAAVGEPEKSE